MKYRKRPIEIEAMQWDGTPEGASSIIDWALSCSSGTIRYNDGPAAPEGGALIIDTLEGVMVGQAADWIICGVAGELYPCKPDIFDATYEPADA